MRTISRHWPRSAPRGDAPARCSYCGVIWRRSLLVRDRAGRLACPDDQRGRDVATLSLENAQGAAQGGSRVSVPSDGIVSTKETITPIPGPGIPPVP